MKRFLLFAFLLVFALFSFGQGVKYSKIKIHLDGSGLQKIAALGLPVEEGTYRPGEYLVSDFSEPEIAKLAENDISFELLVDDVSKFYTERNSGNTVNKADYKGVTEYPVPEGFEFGSMSGHCTFDQMIAHLEDMFDTYPNLITEKEQIGTSVEGRPIWMMKISDNPGTNEAEPEVLYTALHHAREPVGMMQMLFYMYYQLENYDNDPFIQTLVDNTQMYFIPCVNPDGYVYNQQTNPNGGGMWRKNRSNNGSGSYGVDLNRNYGFTWGYNNQGSSGDPWDETYRGTAAFSEPETQAVRDLCLDHDFKIGLNYHTYGNWFLYSWGYIPDLIPDQDIVDTYAEMMTVDNHYTYGSACNLLYEVNGGSDDWMYGEQTAKNKIFSYTPECGGDNDGFWCPQNRIIPICQENMIANLLAAAFTGKYASIEDISPIITNETSGFLAFNLQRLGLADGATYTVSVEPVGNEIATVGDPKVFSNLDIMESVEDSISYTLSGSVQSGSVFSYVLKVDNGDYIISDTITKVYGQVTVIFEDDCNTIGNWTGTWGLSTTSYHSPTGSITDSPVGEYANNINKSTTTNIAVDLTHAAFAMLNFWAKWDIEAGYDYVQCKISTNNGGTWTALEGQYTIPGNGNQATGEPLYDGTQNSWVQEEMNLIDYVGNEVKFRFTIISDSYVTGDGFYFDDFTVSAVNIYTSVVSPDGNKYSVSEAYPNPANNRTLFLYELPASGRHFISLYDQTGARVKFLELDNSKNEAGFELSDVAPGLYYYRLESDGYTAPARKLVVY